MIPILTGDSEVKDFSGGRNCRSDRSSREVGLKWNLKV